MLSDATIRRWCGPSWRIGDSRRTRAAAILSELQAAHADELMRGQTAGGLLQTDYSGPGLGELRLTPSGVGSAVYGTLDFMTPVAEIPLTNVTAGEAGAYERWRDAYQRNWRQFFDPIAARFSISKERLTSELTRHAADPRVQLQSHPGIRRGRADRPNSGDPHTNALARLAFAVNSQSRPIQEAGNFVGNMAPGLKANFLGWLGQSVTLYADSDTFWNELASATNAQAFMEHSFARLPVALYCDVKNSSRSRRLPHRAPRVRRPVRAANVDLGNPGISRQPLRQNRPLKTFRASRSERKLGGYTLSHPIRSRSRRVKTC